jgi:hypothetical protein
VKTQLRKANMAISQVSIMFVVKVRQEFECEWLIAVPQGLF